MRYFALVGLILSFSSFVNAERIHYGVYLDSQYSDCCSSDVPPQPIDVYVVLTGVSSASTLCAWEMQFVSSGSMYFLGVVYEHSAMNFLQFPNCMVGLPSPVTGDPLVIATISVLALGPSGIVVSPLAIPSVPGSPWPLVAMGAGAEDLVPIYPAFGTLYLPQLWVGPGDCPEPTESLDIVATTSTSWSSVKGLFR